MKVFVSNRDNNVAGIFQDRGHETTFDPWESQLDMAVFSGGADIGPWLYGEKKLTVTHPSLTRDLEEIRIWKSLPPKFPKVGICRGAQLGNVLAGGALWQDVNNHQGFHPMMLHDTGEVIQVNSVHHQMCILTPEAKLIGSANAATKKESDDEVKRFSSKADNDWDDPEMFFYDNFNFFAVQFHPEFGHAMSNSIFFKKLEEVYPEVL